MLLSPGEVEALCDRSPGLEAWILLDPADGPQGEASLLHFGGFRSDVAASGRETAVGIDRVIANASTSGSASCPRVYFRGGVEADVMGHTTRQDAKDQETSDGW